MIIKRSFYRARLNLLEHNSALPSPHHLKVFFIHTYSRSIEQMDLNTSFELLFGVIATVLAACGLFVYSRGVRGWLTGRLQWTDSYR